MSAGLLWHSPWMLRVWWFHASAHSEASELMEGRKRWWMSQMCASWSTIRPSLTSRSWKKHFHFTPKPCVTSHQRRSIHMLCTLLYSHMSQIQQTEELTIPRYKNHILHPSQLPYKQLQVNSQWHDHLFYDLACPKLQQCQERDQELSGHNYSCWCGCQ